MITPKENLLKAIDHQEPEWVPCPGIDDSMEVVTHSLTEYSIEEPDDWGVEWKDVETGVGFPKSHPVEEPEEVESYPFPDPEMADLMSPAEEKIEEINRDRSLVIGDNGWGIFERAWMLVGMDKLLKWMYREPEAVKTLMQRLSKLKRKITERFIKEVGVGGVRYGDDWGSQKKIIMGPKLWREFIKPYQTPLYEVCSKNGVLSEQHSDGYIEEIIPDLIDMGLDILNPLQPECNDIEKTKAQFGSDLTFHGVISCQTLDSGTPEDVEREVEKRIEQMNSKGGYIIAPAHAFSYPEENLEAFKKAAIRYGAIPPEWIAEEKEFTSGTEEIEV